MEHYLRSVEAPLQLALMISASNIPIAAKYNINLGLIQPMHLRRAEQAVQRVGNGLQYLAGQSPPGPRHTPE